MQPPSRIRSIQRSRNRDRPSGRGSVSVIIASLLTSFLLSASITVHATDERAAPPDPEVARRLREARIAGMEGRSAEQVRLLEAIARENPDDTSALLALTELASTLPPDADEARRVRKALRGLLLAPNRSAPVSVLQAWALDERTSPADLELLVTALEARAGEPRGGRGEAAGREDPGETESLLLLAGIQERLGRTLEARLTLGRLLERRGDPGVRQRCIHLDIELERWEEALHLVEEQRDVIGEDKLRVPAIMILAALGMTRELDAEMAAFRGDSPLLTREMIDPLIGAGFALLDGGQERRARDWFRLLQERFPDDASIASILTYLVPAAPPDSPGLENGPSGARSRSHRPESAGSPEGPEADQAGSERLPAPRPMDLLNEGTALLSGGDAHAAYPLLRRAAEELADSGQAWFNLGLAAADLQRWAEAEGAFDRSVHLDPSFVKGLVQRAQARLRLGRIEEAAGDAARALELDPAAREAVLVLYHCAKAEGDEEKARLLMSRFREM